MNPGDRAIVMWIYGRRAVRPDGNFYRRQRRHRVARGTRLTAAAGPPRRAGGTLLWIVAGVVVAGVVIYVIVSAVSR
jgi:hypothetical protein